jgi:hypothetical protein
MFYEFGFTAGPASRADAWAEPIEDQEEDCYAWEDSAD